jgi:hypothetical protein
MKPGSAGRVIWSLTMQGGLASLAVTDPGHLLQVVKRSLKTVQCEPDLTGGCLAGQGCSWQRADGCLLSATNQ